MALTFGLLVSISVWNLLELVGRFVEEGVVLGQQGVRIEANGGVSL